MIAAEERPAGGSFDYANFVAGDVSAGVVLDYGALVDGGLLLLKLHAGSEDDVKKDVQVVKIPLRI
jgi:hypothetical protein